MQKQKHIKYFGFSPIKYAIKDKAKQAKMQGALNKALVVKNWEKASAQYVAESMELTRAIDYQNGVLYVACLTKEVAYKIKLLAQRIIESINLLLGKTLVFALNIEF